MTHKPLTITDVAAQHLVADTSKEGAKGLCLSFKNAGCSGFEYTLTPVFEDNALDGFVSFEHNGANLYVAEVEMDRLEGTEVDYVSGLSASRYVFGNPNARDNCGCGKSFRFINEAYNVDLPAYAVPAEQVIRWNI